MPKIKPAGSADSLLIGWNEICRYMRRSRRQLRRYVSHDGLPVCRLGRNVAISRGTIDVWLLTHYQMVKRHRATPRVPTR